MFSLRRVPIVAVCCLLSGGLMGNGAYAMPTDDATTACERAGAAAEREMGLPAGLLLAVGHVESGRWDDQLRRVAPWPWTINAAGVGQWFPSKDAATMAAATWRERGTRSIDVGCFQINLLWHPNAFVDLNEAFDPDANARYAARFLLELYGRAGSWPAAVEAYHSAGPLLGFGYRQQVYAAWSNAVPMTLPPAGPVRRAPAPVVEPVVVYGGVAVWTPVPASAAGEVVAMPGASSSVPAHAPLIALPAVAYHLPAGLIPRR